MGDRSLNLHVYLRCIKLNKILEVCKQCKIKKTDANFYPNKKPKQNKMLKLAIQIKHVNFHHVTVGHQLSRVIIDTDTSYLK